MELKAEKVSISTREGQQKKCLMILELNRATEGADRYDPLPLQKAQR